MENTSVKQNDRNRLPAVSSGPALMIDAHIHLQDEAFDSRRDFLTAQAKQHGVTGFFCAGTAPKDWHKTLDLAKADTAVFPFIGTHPWYAAEHNADLLQELLQKNPKTGIGEIGLDALRKEPRQKEIFESQLSLGFELGRPCTVHCVRAFDVLCPLLKKKNLPPAFLFHAFSGAAPEMDFLASRNGYFSFSGASLHPQRTRAHQLIRTVSLNRILVETDAPDMKPPAGFCLSPDEKMNVPANLPLIIKGIASIRGMDEFELRAVSAENALRFLKG